MQDFMMPVQPGMAGELPPGIPQQPGAGAPPPPAVDYQQLLMEEGAKGDTPGGMGFFDKLRSDPKMTQAMLMAGTRMMQGNKPGQDTMGMLGDAMMAGATAHNMLSYNEEQNALKQQELDMRQRENAARVGQLEQDTRHKAELFPNTKQKLELELQNARTDGERREAEARIKQFEADPERMAKREMLENQRISDQSLASRASAASGFASAANSQEAAKDKRKSAQMKAWAVSGTPEQRQQALDYFTVDDPVTRTADAKQYQLQKLLQEANPQMTKQEVATAALEHMEAQKGERIIALKSIIDNGTDEARAAALEEMQGIVLQHKRGAAPASGGMPPVASRVAGQTTFVNPNGVTLLWDGSKWSPK